MDGDETMKNHRIIIATTIVGLSGLASRAGAAISVTDGMLHVVVNGRSGSDADDEPFVAPGAYAQAQTYSWGMGGGMGWMGGGLGLGWYGGGFGGEGGSNIDVPSNGRYYWPPPPPSPPLSADETVSFADGQVGISTHTDWVRDSAYGGPVVVASGSLNITQDAPETMWVRINSNGLAYRGQVSLDAVGGGNAFYTDLPLRGIWDDAPLDFLVPVTPGQYTLTWSAEGQSALSGGELGGFDFTMGVPEPSSGLLLIAAAAMAFRRRRGRKLPTQAE
jgi:hypothetical protein